MMFFVKLVGSENARECETYEAARQAAAEMLMAQLATPTGNSIAELVVHSYLVVQIERRDDPASPAKHVANFYGQWDSKSEPIPGCKLRPPQPPKAAEPTEWPNVLEGRTLESRPHSASNSPTLSGGTKARLWMASGVMGFCCIPYAEIFPAGHFDVVPELAKPLLFGGIATVVLRWGLGSLYGEKDFFGGP